MAVTQFEILFVDRPDFWHHNGMGESLAISAFLPHS
jgi:hypothetical protein